MNIFMIFPTSGTLEIASEKLIPTGAWLPPLGLLYLGRILENAGHHVTIHDCNAQNLDKQTLENEIHHADIIGLSLYSAERELNNSIKIANQIHEIDPTIPIIVGGPHCSLYPEKALEQHHATVCIPGCAEQLIIPVVDACAGLREWNTIPNIYYYTGSSIKHNTGSTNPQLIDELPFPARYLVDKYDYGYLLRVKYSVGKTTSMCVGLGCPYSCRFCNLHMHIPQYRSRSATNCIKELDEVIDKGYRTIAFVDDNFMVNPHTVEAIMDHLIERNADIRMWILGARVDSANKYLYQKMSDAGVEFISFGIESGNQDVLDYYNKKITVSQIKDAVNLSRKMGFFVTATFILGAPIETKKHIKNTIRFAQSIPLDSVTFYPFGYVFKSEIWNEAVEQGLISLDEGDILADSARGLGNIERNELLDYTMKAHNQFYLNPKLWVREITRAITDNDFRHLHVGFRMLFD